MEWNAFYNQGKLYLAFLGMFFSTSSNSLPLIVSVLNELQAPRVRGEGKAGEAAAGGEHNRAIKGSSEYESYSWSSQIGMHVYTLPSAINLGAQKLDSKSNKSHLIHPAIELCST